MRAGLSNSRCVVSLVLWAENYCSKSSAGTITSIAFAVGCGGPAFPCYLTSAHLSIEQGAAGALWARLFPSWQLLHAFAFLSASAATTCIGVLFVCGLAAEAAEDFYSRVTFGACRSVRRASSGTWNAAALAAVFAKRHRLCVADARR